MPPAPRKAPAKAVPRRPVADANFLPKRQRKQVRKSMVRAYLANRVTEAREGARDRAEFYRNLRAIKMRRRAIAKEMQALAVTVSGLQQDLRRLEDRGVEVDLGLLDECYDLARSAVGSTHAAAAEWELFSRRRVYYTELVAA